MDLYLYQFRESFKKFRFPLFVRYFISLIEVAEKLEKFVFIFRMKIQGVKFVLNCSWEILFVLNAAWRFFSIPDFVDRNT